MSPNKVFIFSLITLCSCSSKTTDKETTSVDRAVPVQQTNDSSYNDIRPMLDKSYSFSDGYHDMLVEFKTVEDTCYVYYLNVLDNGNYINSTDDSTEYAAKFPLNNLEAVNTGIPFRNYRFEDGGYQLRLQFYPKQKEIMWNVGPAIVSYLPEKAVLTEVQ